METNTVSQKIGTLETEILKIEELIKEKQIEKRLIETWRALQKGTEDQKGQENVQNAAENKDQLDLLQRLTGVEFNRTDVEILGQGRLWLTKLFRIEGSCMGEEFKLQLEIKEMMNEDGSVTSEIIGFTVEHLTVKHKEMLKHIELLKEENNVQAFFVLLRSYMKWSKVRRDTFEHFLTTHPEITSQTNNQCLQLKHLQKDCVFQIDWSIIISSNHLCYPEISLSVQMNAVSPSNNILTKTPDMFQLMLKELGIEKTINSLVTLCSE